MSEAYGSNDVQATWTLRELADELGLTKRVLWNLFRQAGVHPRRGSTERVKGRYWLSDLRNAVPHFVESLVERRRVRRVLDASDAGDVEAYIEWRDRRRMG